MRKYLILLLFMITASANAQLNPTDSLEQIVKKLSGAERVRVLQKIGSQYFSSNIDKTSYYYRLAFKESTALKDTVLMALSLTNIAAINSLHNNLKFALDTFQISNNLFLKAKYYVGAVFCQSQIATVYAKLGKYDLAVPLFTKALSYYTFDEVLDSIKSYQNIKGELSDHQKRFLSVQSTAINDFALAYHDMGFFEKSIEMFQRAYKIGKALKRKDRIGAALSNLGMCYNGLNKPELAIKYYKEAIELFREINNRVYLASTLDNLARIYIEKKDYKEAQKFALESIACYEIMKDNAHPVYSTIAEIELQMKNYQKALYYLKRSEDVYSSREMLPLLMSTYEGMRDVYEAMGDLNKSLDYSKKLNSLKDTLYDGERIKQLTALLAFYEVDQKSKEVNLLKKDIEISNAKIKQGEFQTLTFIVTALFLALLLIGLFTFYRVRMKSNRIIEQKNKELEQLNSNLIESNDTKDKFFSIIAHDIKNPIASVKQVSEILTDDMIELNKEEQDEFLMSLRVSSVHLLKLLDNLLTWARSQTGKIACEREYCEFDSQTEGEIEMIAGQAVKKNISINLVKSDIKLFADPNMLSTIVRNLISNAIKFTMPGGNIEITSEIMDDDFAKISIKDSGVGMTDTVKEKLFKLGKNRSERGTDDEDGTGFGLILCKEFVERNGGTMTVESNEGKGSIFSFTMPLYKEK